MVAPKRKPRSRATVAQHAPDGGDQPGAFESALLRLRPPASFEANVREALGIVGRLARSAFGPEAFVLPFGSVVQGAHLDGSDLDVCVDVPGLVLPAAGAGSSNAPQVEALRQLLRRLPRGFRVIETRLWKGMKVPIIILGYAAGAAASEVEVDVSIGTVFEGVEKGSVDQVIRALFERCPRALHSARLVKRWARMEKLNKAYDGFLNALGWTLLVLYFFMEHGEISTADVADAGAIAAVASADGSHRKIPPSLAQGAREDFLPSRELLGDFFAWVVDFAGRWPEGQTDEVWAVSLVDGDVVAVPAGGGKRYADQCSFFIEDPGIRLVKGVSENVARSLKVGAWRETLGRCRRAADALAASDSAASAWLRGYIPVSNDDSAPATHISALGARAKAMPRRPPWAEDPSVPAIPERKRPRPMEAPARTVLFDRALAPLRSGPQPPREPPPQQPPAKRPRRGGWW
eukprot:TRINITY_DN23607_c0_g5_i1.p1 TRINITY_DN23607_c0_g5~~TRINITY_DN23607_c0_g5_i1.p1  ORF type:complete len:474 (-),score=95.78 TRINITY_DN23607_c0_g5_i1:78-1463(-)